MPPTPSVEVSECAYSYGKAPALDGVSFRVPPGSIFGLLGPNGSGKTTLFRILSTLLVPDTGSAKVFGIDTVANPIEARRQMGIVFQTQSLDRRLSVEENLRHQGHMYGMWGTGLAARVNAVLERVGLAGRQKDIVETLSGGLRRRADLAKGLLHRPKLLLLDEPSTGLDPAARLSFWHYLEDLRHSDGVTVLLTTHLLDEADRCDRLAILDRGQLIREGQPDELKAEIGEEVITLATSVPSEVSAILTTEFGVQDARMNGREIRFEHAGGANWTVRVMERFGKRIESVKVSRPSLEDVFLHHAGHGFDTEARSWAQAPHITS